MRRKVFTAVEMQTLRQMLDNKENIADIAKALGVSESKIRNICKENGIECVSWHSYVCVVCGKEFKATHRTAICEECKSTPAVCVVCGKEFTRISPYTQKTCSSKCRGIYRKESGIAKSVGAKMKQTKLEKYGTLDPGEVAKLKSGSELAPKKCKLCGKEFIPNTPRQVYCTDKHYGACPVCGKKVEIKDYNIGPQACSEECRMQRIYKTNLERYGNKDAVNSEHAKKLAREHSLERYGYEYYSQSPEAKQHYKDVMKEKYGVNAPIQVPEFREKAIKTNLEKYGTEWASQSEEFKKKVAQTHAERYGGIGTASPELREKIVQTNLEKYGYEFPFQNEEIQNKIHQDSLEKNGTPWPARSEEANKKRAETNLEKYGSEHIFGSPEIQGKIKEGWIEKYGGPNPMCDPEIAELANSRRAEVMLEKYGTKSALESPEIRQKISETIQERYGVPWYVMTDECIERNYHAISVPNREFSAALNSLGINNSFEYRINRQSFDIKIDDSNILIEIDPTFTHNSFDTIWHDPKDRDYHLMKTQLAEENGYACIHVFDWDNSRAVLNLLRKKTAVYARKCDISLIDKNTANAFSKEYHLQGSCRGQDIVYGLYYEGELVEMMSFGKPRYNKNFDFELLRLCTKHGIQVIGGASRLFKHFVKDNPGKSVISYCDYAKFNGSVYEKIGMKFERLTPPAKVWSKGAEYITDNYLRQRGYDQIFKANYGKGTSNEQLMLDHGWLPVYDCGQKVFVYK